MKPQPPNPEHKRMKRERQTIEIMTHIYCKGHHDTHGELCPECQQFQEYALMRLAKCPFQDKKTTCGKCTIHCYKPDMKLQVRKVMRYSGPRLLIYHPDLALHHAWDARRKPPTLDKQA
jgi:hypothetical protein